MYINIYIHTFIPTIFVWFPMNSNWNWLSHSPFQPLSNPVTSVSSCLHWGPQCWDKSWEEVHLTCIDSVFQKYWLTTARFCHCIFLRESAGDAFLNIHCYWVPLILLLSTNFFVLAFLWCAAQVALVVKNSPANSGDIRDVWVWSLGLEDPLEEGMAAHSSILAWESLRLAGYSP